MRLGSSLCALELSRHLSVPWMITLCFTTQLPTFWIHWEEAFSLWHHPWIPTLEISFHPDSHSSALLGQQFYIPWKAGLKPFLPVLPQPMWLRELCVSAFLPIVLFPSSGCCLLRGGSVYLRGYLSQLSWLIPSFMAQYSQALGEDLWEIFGGWVQICSVV